MLSYIRIMGDLPSISYEMMVFMTRRILCIALALLMAFTVFGCGSSEESSSNGSTTTKVDTSLKSGTPSTVGDKFNAPSIEQDANGPVIGEISKQALPDDTITIAGKGFSDSSLKAYVYGLDKDGKETTKEAKYTVIDDQLMSLIIDKSFDYGVFGVYLENSKGKSAVDFVNAPAIWYVGMTNLTKGDICSVYGENLTTDLGTKSHVYLVGDGKYCETEIVSADPYKISFKVPAGLDDGAEYEIRIHTGHGGDIGFATAPQKLLYSENDPDTFNGDVIDVTDYGYDPTVVDTTLDASTAISEAIASANDGDIIYFPSGIYFCNTNISVDKSVKFAGAGTENTYIVTGNQLENRLFNVEVGHVEFVNITFRHVRSSGRIKSGFIQYRGDFQDTGIFNLYIHDCHFIQSVPSSAKFNYYCISVYDAANVIIENNTFDSLGTVSFHNAEKVFIKNNDAKIGLYVGAYYGQDSSHFTNVNRLDISGNNYIGKDAENDDSGMLDTNDMTVGRFVVIQGYSNMNYISHNTTKASGIPGTNAGELILYEHLYSRHEGPVAASDGTTVTLPEGTAFQASKGDIITITKGTGKGQYAYVKSTKKNVITLEDEFKVAPDTTSTILISNNFSNSAVYKNHFNGYANYADTRGGATTCIQVYGGMHNLFFTDNYGEYLPEGVCITPYYKGEAQCVTYWSHFDRNEFFETGVGIRYFMNTQKGSGEIAGEYSVGVTLRSNKIKNTRNYKNDQGGDAIQIGYHPGLYAGGENLMWNGNWINGVVVEHCTFEGSEFNDIELCPHSGNTILRDNKNVDSEGKVKLVVSGGDGYIEVKD